MTRSVATTVALALISSAAFADWPQFRGPGRTGIGDSTGLATKWGEGGPTELWRHSIGVGYSGVTAVGDRLYTMATGADGEEVLALDAATGAVQWRIAVGPSKTSDLDDTGPRTTPAVADGRVYTASSAGRLVALAVDDGALEWEQTLMAAEAAPRFGYSMSPLVDAGLVLMEGGGSDEESGVRAFDAATGELRWEALEGPSGYSSPIAAEIAGVRQYLFFRRVGGEVVSLSTAGEVLWRHPTAGLAIITTPIFLPPDRVFVASADDVFGGLMILVENDQGTWRTEEAWSERLMRNHFNSSVLVEGHLYGFDNGTFRCLDARTGARKWARRGLGKGSLVAADGLLFVLGDDGSLLLVPASPDGFVEAGRVQAMTGRAWTAPSLAAGRLYLRDFDEIVAYDLEDPAARSTGAGR